MPFRLLLLVHMATVIFITFGGAFRECNVDRAVNAGAGVHLSFVSNVSAVTLERKKMVTLGRGGEYICNYLQKSNGICFEFE